MGIHHTYKSKRGERSLVKQQKQDDLRRRADHRKQQNQPQQDSQVYVVPVDEVVTLDTLTNPNKK